METFPVFLRGYRAWVPTDVGGAVILGPVSKKTCIADWRGGSCTARCHVGYALLMRNRQEVPEPENPHEAPFLDCTCGVWARYIELEEYRAYPIVGSVRATGRVVLQEKGFRAQHCVVEALAPGYSIVAQDVPWARNTADSLGVPFFPTMSALQREFPPTNLDGIVDIEEYQERRRAERIAQWQEQWERLNSIMQKSWMEQYGLLFNGDRYFFDP